MNTAISYFTVGSTGSLGLRKHIFIKTGNLSGTIWVRDSAGNLSNPTPFALISATHPPITLTVNTVADRIDPPGSATVSLRDAMTQAGNSLGPVTIVFDPTVFVTAQAIMLRGSGLEMSGNTFGATTVIAPRAGLIVSGSGIGYGLESSVLTVDPGITLNLVGLIIVGGQQAGIINHGTMTLSRCNISHNHNSFYGGGIDNFGTMTITDSAIDKNSTDLMSQHGGGGIDNTGTMSLIRTKVFQNSVYSGEALKGGGGIVNDGGTMTISASVISGNQSNSFAGGGGISNYSGYLTISDSVISSNSSHSYDGGIGNSGILTISNSSISDNSGTGIRSFSQSPLILQASVVSGNTDGALSVYFGTVTNCTIAGNTTGGGISVNSRGMLTVNDSTIAGNSGAAGIYLGTGTFAGRVTLANTIVADNTADGGRDVFGTVTSLGHNLIGATSGSSGWLSSDLTGTAAKPLDAKLSPLGNHGGPTQTQFPLAGSPALGVGSVALIPKGITTDQRGKPRVVGGKVDIGAVEVQPNEV